MKILLDRQRYSNTYDVGEGKLQAVLGGVPNVPVDVHGNLEPLDNELQVDTTHPRVRWLLKRGPFEIGFHDRVNDKFGIGVRLHTGERLTKRLIGDPTVTPTILNKHTIEWRYGNGAWIREYAIEKHIKEVVFQKAGQALTFEYDLLGLTPKKTPTGIDFLIGQSKAFHLSRPYYTNTNRDFLGYVPINIELVNGKYRVVYPAPATDVLIDPTLVFGEGVGQIGGDHKDTSLQEANTDKAIGDNAALFLRIAAGATELATQMRFSLTGHIPTDAVVSSSVLKLYVSATRPVNTTISAHPLVTDWGITPTAEGVTEEPATAGQATWRRAFDFNGAGGDVPWAGGNFSAADYGAAEDSFLYPAGGAIGTSHTLDIPIMTAAWVLNDATNYGLALIATGANNNTPLRLDSQESATVGERPSLTVAYTVPVPPPPPPPTPTYNDIADLILTNTIFHRKPNWMELPKRDYDNGRDIAEMEASSISFVNITDALPHEVGYGFTNVDKSEEKGLLDFIDWSQGRLRRFWLPVWKNTFRLQLDIVVYDNFLLVDDTHFVENYQGYERIFIETKSGIFLTRKVIGVVDNGNGTETLTIESIMDRNITVEDIAYFGRLLLVRFGKDEIAMKHDSSSVSECGLTFRELVREYILPSAVS